MFCKKCGTQNVDGAVFCRNCGASMMSQPVAEQAYQQPEQQPEQQGGYNNYNQQNYQQNYQQVYQTMEQTYSSNPVVNAIKKIAASPLFLVGTILFTCYLVLTFFSAVTGNAALNAMADFSDMLDSKALNSAVTEMYSAMASTTLVSMIPSIIAVIGLWLIYAAGKNTYDQGMKTSGLTMLKGIAIYQLVGLCIASGLVVIGMFIIMAGLSSLKNSLSAGMLNIATYSSNIEDSLETFAGVAAGLLVFIIIVLIAVLVFMIIWYVKTIKTINSIKNAINSGAPAHISMFLIVMLFITGGANCLSFSFAGICYGVSMILFAVALVKLKEELEKASHQLYYEYDPNMNYQAQQIPNNNF